MLTPGQRDEFEQRGYLRLRGAFDRAAAERMADRVWDHLARHRGVRRNDPGTWAIDAPWGGLKALKDEPLFQSIGTPQLRAAIDGLLGAGAWRMPRNWGGFLVSFPDGRPDAWNLPVRGWHVDAHLTSDPDTLFALRVFTFLTEVGERGGGTLVVAGSHRLVRRFVAGLTPEEREAGYAPLTARFKQTDRWLAELSSGDASEPARVGRFMHRSHEIDGVPVRVEQLCGSPGDVVLAHPWILHVTAPNAGPGPRFMTGKDIPCTASRATAATAVNAATR